jgi:hypothetical protein
MNIGSLNLLILGTHPSLPLKQITKYSEKGYSNSLASMKRIITSRVPCRAAKRIEITIV